MKGIKARIGTIMAAAKQYEACCRYRNGEGDAKLAMGTSTEQRAAHQ